jgi:LysM repeat protein
MPASSRKNNKEADLMTDHVVTPHWTNSVLLMILGVILSLTGCVTKESYTQQVNRTTNLQRLLADEEKRSSDLSSEVARLKTQVSDLESQNKQTSDQLKDARSQVVRSLEEVGRLQEDVESRRAGAKPRRPGVSPAPTEPPDRLGELQSESLGKGSNSRGSAGMHEEKAGGVHHEVKRGDTLFSLAKRYKTSVNKLRELNGLADNEIHAGERLLVR